MALGLSACGLQNEIPSDLDSIGDDVVYEDAVFIAMVSSNPQGKILQCELNPAVIGVKEVIPVHLELEGVVIASGEFRNRNARVTFNDLSASAQGLAVCVIEFADAEFASDPLWIEAVDL